MGIFRKGEPQTESGQYSVNVMTAIIDFAEQFQERFPQTTSEKFGDEHEIIIEGGK